MFSYIEAVYNKANLGQNYGQIFGGILVYFCARLVILQPVSQGGGAQPGPLFRQPCNLRLQALSHFAGIFEEKTMQKD